MKYILRVYLGDAPIAIIDMIANSKKYLPFQNNKQNIAKKINSSAYYYYHLSILLLFILYIIINN